MGLPVGADDTAAIDSEQYRQILDGDVVNHLIISALQKSRVNCHDRTITANSKPSGEGDGVLLGDSHIEILLRVLAGESHHAGAFTHGRGNRHQPAVACGGFRQPLTKDGRVGGQRPFLAFRQSTAGWIEFRHGVPTDRILFGGGVAFAFLGHDVQQLRPFEAAHIFERLRQRLHIMPIHRADIVKTEFFK